jgi:hypothetical protein
MDFIQLIAIVRNMKYLLLQIIWHKEYRYNQTSI